MIGNSSKFDIAGEAGATIFGTKPYRTRDAPLYLNTADKYDELHVRFARQG